MTFWCLWSVSSQRLDFQRHMSFCEFKWEVINHFVDIGGIVDHHCLNFLWTKHHLLGGRGVSWFASIVSNLHNFYCKRDNSVACYMDLFAWLQTSQYFSIIHHVQWSNLQRQRKTKTRLAICRSVLCTDDYGGHVLTLLIAFEFFT
jgi:hypothetical protein